MSHEQRDFELRAPVRDGGRNPNNFFRHECNLLGNLYVPDVGAEPDFEKMTDAEHLMRVFELLQDAGEKASGPDGVKYRDLGKVEVADAMRDLSKRLRDGTWEAGPARTTNVSKKLGNGTRPLRLRSVFAAVVSKVLHDALQSFWDQRFLNGCCAYRPGRGPNRMLAEILWAMKRTDCCVIAQADVANAFENVDVDEVARLHRVQLANNRLTALIETMLRTDIEGQRVRTRGIDQGSAYSVHCLNARLHEIHDVHIKDDVPGWWRYADDLTYLCRSVSEGDEMLCNAQELFGPTEFTLKDWKVGCSGPVSDLKRGDAVELLGFTVTLHDDRLRFAVSPTAWDGLRGGLRKAHESSDPPESARHCVWGWIMAYGPAFEGSARCPVLQEVRHVMRSLGFRDCVHDRDLLGRASRAFRHWRSCMRRACKRSMSGTNGLAGKRSAITSDDVPGKRIPACPALPYGDEGSSPCDDSVPF